MALADVLNELAGTGPASRNRVEILLDKLKAEKPEDYKTLTFALRSRNLSAAQLTKALRKEFGTEAVKDNSVSEWRRRNTAELTGL
jgi:hypothetical protein